TIPRTPSGPSGASEPGSAASPPVRPLPGGFGALGRRAQRLHPLAWAAGAIGRSADRLQAVARDNELDLVQPQLPAGPRRLVPGRQLLAQLLAEGPRRHLAGADRQAGPASGAREPE